MGTSHTIIQPACLAFTGMKATKFHTSIISAYPYPSENQNKIWDSSHDSRVSVYQYPSENQNNLVLLEKCDLVSVYQYPSENQNAGDRMADSLLSISLSISIREPKLVAQYIVQAVRISLSISIREPKPDNCADGIIAVSVYQYPSENQNFPALQ